MSYESLRQKIAHYRNLFWTYSVIFQFSFRASPTGCNDVALIFYCAPNKNLVRHFAILTSYADVCFVLDNIYTVCSHSFLLFVRFAASRSHHHQYEWSRCWTTRHWPTCHPSSSTWSDEDRTWQRTVKLQEQWRRHTCNCICSRRRQRRTSNAKTTTSNILRQRTTIVNSNVVCNLIGMIVNTTFVISTATRYQPLRRDQHHRRIIVTIRIPWIEDPDIIKDVVLNEIVVHHHQIDNSELDMATLRWLMK